MRLVTEWYGSFLLDGDRVQRERLFPLDVAALAERLLATEAGDVLEEERALASEAKGPLQVSELRLLTLPSASLVQAAPARVHEGAQKGFDAELFRQALLELARRKVRAASGGRDQHVVQAVQAIDDLAETANQLAERLREWYGLHFPESDRLVETNEEMATLISSFTTRDAILAKNPHLRLARPSMGAELGEVEQAALRGYAKALSSLYAQRAELDRYLETNMPAVAPNVTKMVGAQIAARLLFHAGSLKGLASMPSGTIQTLGAEKALFRHLKEGKRPPKHGVIFQHPLIHRSPFRQRGPLARTLAGKIAIAARADAYTHHDIAAELQKSLDVRTRDVRNAPPKRPRPAQPKKGRPGFTPQPGHPAHGAGHAKPGTGEPRGPQAGSGFGYKGEARGRPPGGVPPPSSPHRDDQRRDRDRDRRRR